MPDDRETPRSEILQVFESKITGLPNLSGYFRELWRRREFALELSKSALRAQQANTVIGRFWLILNPLLLATVYYFLVVILSGGANKGAEYFAHLLGSLFLFYFISNSMTGGAGSVVGAGKLIMNASFPRLLLPLSAVRTAFFRFIPTLPIFFIAYAMSGGRFSFVNLLAIPSFIIILIFASGLAMIFATAQVYFRDTATILPYAIRILLYISPVLYYPDQAQGIFRAVANINPLYSLLGIWSETLILGTNPGMGTWIQASLWAFFTLFFGCWFFMSKEREFPVRL